MNKLGLFLQNFAMDYGIKAILKLLKDNKVKNIEYINKKYNLPMLNEKQEAELFGVFYDIMEDLVENIKKQ
tara:strand:- start:166 stop:378 length:213 start_codon:yes stop_codon:yes gene_type:complete